MSIANRPVLSSQGGSINAQNTRWEPGAVYDSVLQLVQQPAPPVDFDEEIQNNKSLAEQRVESLILRWRSSWERWEE
jgi:hypothetical protein